MKENESEYKDLPAFTVRSRNSSKFFIFFIIFFLCITGVLAGLFFLGFSKRNESMIHAPTAPATAKITSSLPTSSASAMFNISVSPNSPTGLGLSPIDGETKLDRGALKVSILNGSGEPGAAGGVSSYLKSLGYNIASVGNADIFTYQNLTIIVKSSKSGYVSLLKKDLQANPSFASVSASINNSISTDAEIIVGK